MRSPGPACHRFRALRAHLRWGPLLAMTLLVALGQPAAALPGGSSSMPAAAAAVRARIQLTSVQPGVARGDREVVVSATVTNTGTEPLSNTAAILILGRGGLQTRPEIAAWAAAKGTGPRAREVARVALPPVDSGRSRAVVLRLPRSALNVAQTFAILPLSVELRSASARLAELHTFLPYERVKEYVPLELAFAVPLTLDPDPELFQPIGAVRDAAWAAALGPGSRLQKVIDGTADAPVTWAVDPLLVNPPAVTAVPVTASTPPTSAGPGAGTGATTPASPGTAPATASNSDSPSGPQADVPAAAVSAAALAGRLKGLAPRHTVWQLPFSDPDLAAVLSARPADVTVQSLMAEPADLSALGADRVSRVAWPADGAITQQREVQLRRLYADEGLEAAVTVVSLLPSTSGFTATAAHKSADGLPLLAADDELSRLFARTSVVAEAALTVQRFLAETLALLGERPGTSRSVLVTAPRSFAGDPDVLRSLFAAVAQAPWLRTTSTTTLLDRSAAADPDPAGAPTTTRTPTPAGAAKAPASPITAARLAAVDRTRSELAGVASILADGPAFQQGWSAAQAQLFSTRWRGQPKPWLALDAAARAAVDTVADGIHVEPRTINFFADEGVIQITVVNTLDVAVRDVQVRLSVPRRQANRLRIDGQPDALRIGANSRATVRQNVIATASGRVSINAALRTANGTALGQPAEVALRVRPTATWIFWVLGGIAGVILVLGVVRALRPRPSPGPSLDPSLVDPVENQPRAAGAA